MSLSRDEWAELWSITKELEWMLNTDRIEVIRSNDELRLKVIIRHYKSAIQSVVGQME